MGGFQSGQMGQTVNLLSLTSVVRIHLPPPSTDCPIGRSVLFLLWIRKGAAVNDAPVARQSRGTARPQAGESTFPHQTSIRKDGRFCFAGTRRRSN